MTEMAARSKPALRMENGRRPSGPSIPDRLPPHSVEAEQSVLGAALISKTAVERALEMLERDDFYLEAHRKVFDVVAYLAERYQPVDLLTVPEELKRRGQLERVGGITYLITLENSVPHAVNVEHYAEIVQKKSIRRRAIHAAGDIIARSYDEADDEAASIPGEAVAQFELLRKRQKGRKAGPRVYTAAELENMEFQEPAWLLTRLLPVPSVALLCGWPKSKKTFLAGDFAAALAQGGYAFGKMPVDQTPALCCFTEDPIEDAKGRLERVLATGWPEHLHLTEECPRMDEGGETWLRHYLTEHPDVRYVVLDPLINVRGSGRRGESGIYTGDYDDMNAFKRIVREHQVCLLLIHHVNKIKSDDPFACISGSNGILGAVDVAMVLVTDDEVQTAVLHAKGRRVRRLKWALQWSDHAGWVYAGEAGDGPQYPSELRPLINILSSQRDPVRHSDLVRALMQTGCRESAAKMRIRNAKELGLINGDSGLYWVSKRTVSEEVVDYVDPADRRDALTILTDPEGNAVNTGRSVNSVNGHHPPPTPELPAPLDLEADMPEREADLRQRTFNLAWSQDFPHTPLDADHAIAEGEENWRYECRVMHGGLITAALLRLGGKVGDG